MNAAEYPQSTYGQQYKFEEAPYSYWPRVVASGDVEWARELLTRHGADPNWPLKINATQQIKAQLGRDHLGFALGATVLMIAVLRQDAAMVELLVDHGADVNLAEFLEVLGDDFAGAERPSDYFFVTDAVLAHYWNTTAAEAALPLVAPDDKKATPLSVARGTGNSKIIELLQARGAVETPGATPASVPALNCGSG